MEEELLGLSSLMDQQQAQPDPSPPLLTVTQPSQPATSSADDIPLPRFLFSYGLSPSGPASAEMLLSLLHHEGIKSVDARLKECGVKQIGKRLQIQNALQHAAAKSSVTPPAPRDMPRPVAVQVDSVIVVTGDVSSIKGPSARDVVQELTGGENVSALITLAAQDDRDELTAALKQRGFKTGARLKLESALRTVAEEQAAAKALKAVEDSQEVQVAELELSPHLKASASPSLSPQS